MNNKYFLSKDLFLEIDLIGYKKQGESVIISLKSSENNYLWTAVIDSFKRNNENITVKNLEEMGYGDNKKIDLLMITHPDLDHIKDIETIINNYTDETTKYLMPDFFNSNVNETIDIKKIKKLIQEKYLEHSSGLLNNIFYNKVINEPNLKWKWVGSDNKTHMLKVESYLPTDSIMTMSRYANNQHKNEYSLFVNVIVDNVNFVFTGDCVDYSLSLLNVEDLDKMRNTLYFKIPHHGSENTTMFNKFIDNDDIGLISSSACAFRENVTNKSVLEYYCMKSPDLVSLTCDENSDDNYGIVKHVYNIKKRCIEHNKCLAIGNGILNIKK